jgi:hypothetical protein
MTTRPKKKKRKARRKTAKKTRGRKPARLRAKVARKRAKTAKAAKRAPPKKAGAPGKKPGGALRRPLASAGRRFKSERPGRIARGRVTPRRGPPRSAAAVPRVPGVIVSRTLVELHAGMLTPAALRFIADLHRAFEAARVGMLAAYARDDGEPHPRSWHTIEARLTVDRAPVAAALLEFGLHAFHKAAGDAAVVYELPPLWSVDEARLWNDLFAFAHERLGIPSGTLRATIPAPISDELHEILSDYLAAPD